MPKFEHSYLVRARLEDVLDLHRDTRSLHRLAGPLMHTRNSQRERVHEGAMAECTVWLGPIPTRWVVRYRRVDAERGFVSYMVEGPLHRWEHKYRFIRADETTVRIEHSLAYKHLPLPRGILARAFFNQLTLALAFRSRRRAVERLLRERA